MSVSLGVTDAGHGRHYFVEQQERVKESSNLRGIQTCESVLQFAHLEKVGPEG